MTTIPKSPDIAIASVQDYDLAQGETPEQLTAAVVKRLRAGWTLYGQPFAAPPGFTQGGGPALCQAMVKRAASKPSTRVVSNP